MVMDKDARKVGRFPGVGIEKPTLSRIVFFREIFFSLRKIKMEGLETRCGKADWPPSFVSRVLRGSDREEVGLWEEVPIIWDAIGGVNELTTFYLERPLGRMKEGHKLEYPEADDVYLGKWISSWGPSEENISDGLGMEVRRADNSYAFFSFSFSFLF